MVLYRKEHFKLYTETYHTIAVNSCQIELARKDLTLPSDAAMILYKARLCTGVEDKHIKFALSACTYSIDDFDLKVKIAVLW